jgi:PKD repeat protein
VNTSTVTVNVNASPVVTATTANASICVGDTSTLTAGGATSYVWSSGGTSATEQVSPSTTTTYTVTGTAANSCTNTATVTVNVNTLPTVTATTANASICVGGSATLTAGGATSYVWSSGGTSPTEQVSPATATTYTVTGTDANGCVNTATVIVNVNALPTVNLGADVTQCGGTLTLDAQNQGSTYLWSDNSMMQTLVVSTTGNYSVAVTDINGCVNTDSIVVTIDSVVIVNLGSDTTRCGGWVSLNAGNPGSTYLWSNSATGQASIVTSSGTYYVDVTTPSGCTGSDTIVVTINNQPIANLGPDTATCQGNITLDAGNPGSTYVWSNSASTQTITVGAGTYFVTVTDPSGCSDRDTISIQVNTPPTITVSSDTAICVGGQATLTASGGTGYLWSNGAPTQSITVSPTTSTAYYVTVTDSNICTASDFVIVNVLPGSTSQFTHTVSGSTAVFTNQSSNANTYNWNFGDNTTSNAVNPSHTYTQNGTFTVTLTVTGPCGSATFTQVVTITQVGLVEQGSLSDGINVYPNPNNGVFTLAINANLGDVVIEVVDMQGRVVYASNENNVQTGFTKQIGMETASSGMYMLRMTSTNQVHVVKMNVQR